MEYMQWLSEVFTRTFNFMHTEAIGGYTVFSVLISLIVISGTFKALVHGVSK